jgi:hypothetical protein
VKAWRVASGFALAAAGAWLVISAAAGLRIWPKRSR